MPINNERRLYKLGKMERRWEDCQACSLSKSRTRLVHYRGNPCSPILAIGEAPGESEDEQGVPFVGASGRLLGFMLGMAACNDVFIVNMVACRPQNNAKPTSEHMVACKPRLERILSIVRPKVILLIGGTAAKAMTGVTSISSWRGECLQTCWEWRGQHYETAAVVTYHPSYILRRGKDKKIIGMVVKDIEFAMELAQHA